MVLQDCGTRCTWFKQPAEETIHSLHLKLPWVWVGEVYRYNQGNSSKRFTKHLIIEQPSKSTALSYLDLAGELIVKGMKPKHTMWRTLTFLSHVCSFCVNKGITLILQSDNQEVIWNPLNIHYHAPGRTQGQTFFLWWKDQVGPPAVLNSSAATLKRAGSGWRLTK